MAATQTTKQVCIFLLGPGLLALATAAAFSIDPWATPVPEQAAVFNFTFVAPVIALAAVGVGLSTRIGVAEGLTAAEPRWRLLLLLATGALVGAVWLAMDVMLGGTEAVAGSQGATWVHVPLPQSLWHYAAGGVLVECLYRLIPIPIFTWLISNFALRGRGQAPVFWTLAIVTSLLEPAGLLTGELSHRLIAPMLLAFGFNLFEAWHFRRHGWAAPIMLRIGFYLVWHCFGPYLLPADSMLYPGQR